MNRFPSANFIRYLEHKVQRIDNLANTPNHSLVLADFFLSK